MQTEVWKRNQVDAATIADKVLYTRLAETIAWTNAIVKRDDFRPAMRDHRLQPGLLHEGRDDVSCQVGISRQHLLRIEIGTMVVQKCPDLLGGRLMVYFPDDNLSDGAAEQETDGFFDGNNAPPWETWVGYFKETSGRPALNDWYLLAYVPSTLVSLANSGINVNPEECIRWLAQTTIKIRSRFPDEQGSVSTAIAEQRK